VRDEADPRRTKVVGSGKLRENGLILFDLDNTLMGRQAFRNWAEYFSECEGLGSEAVALLCELDRDGLASREMVFAGLRDVYPNMKSVEELVRSYREEYPSFISPDPKVLELLDRLRAEHWDLSVITNGPVSQRDKLRRTGIIEYVDSVVISDEIGIEKPDPAVFAHAIQELGYSYNRQSCWMIGDQAQTDIAGALNFGIGSIWLTQGRQWTEDDFFPTCQMIDIFAALELFLK
jgi:putative hydrolase of the HAD superfamily